MYRKGIFLILIVIMAVIVMKVIPRGENETMRTEGSDAVYIAQMRAKIAQANHDVEYTAMYRYHHIYCTFLVNDIPIHSPSGKPIMMSFVGRIGALLAEGENTIGIWAMNIPEDPEGAYCEMIVHASVYNDETGESESKEVSSIKVTIDDKGKFVATESKTYPEPSLTGAVTLKELDEITFNQGVENDAIATRSLTVNHPHKTHSWQHRSTPFEDTPVNREKLWAKYEEFRSALAAKDEKRYQALEEPGLTETERYMGDPETGSFAESMMEFVHEAWAAEDFKVLPIDRDNYQLMIGADGRLFRFINMNSADHMASPIRFQENGRARVFNYTFTLIDDEIVNAY